MRFRDSHLLLEVWGKHKTPHLLFKIKLQTTFMNTEVKEVEKFNWFKMFWAGFTTMSKQSRTLWIIVIVKLIVMFAILRPIFFPNFLKSQSKDKTEQADYVREQMIERSTSPIEGNQQAE